MMRGVGLDAPEPRCLGTLMSEDFCSLPRKANVYQDIHEFRMGG